MNRWIATRDELRADFERMVAANQHYAPGDLARYTDARHPAHGGPVTYRIAFEWGDGPAKVITPSPRMLWMLMQGGVIRHARVVADDPQTGLPVLEGTGDLLPAMSEREAIDFIAWRDVPAGCNRVEIITTADLPETRAFRNAWRLAA